MTTYWDHHWMEWSSYPDPDDYGPNVWSPESDWTELDELMLQEHFNFSPIHATDWRWVARITSKRKVQYEHR